MSAVQPLEGELTAKARIRDVALHTFAQQGVAATSLRTVAKHAGVSPALVVHHFGSKQGLCRAVDEAVIERITLALHEAPLDGPAPEYVAARAEAIIARLRGQPVIFDYLARALAEGTESSGELFHRIFETARKDRHLVRAGLLRGDTDPFWRTVQQIVLIVGPLMLRRHLERELGRSLLDERTFARWMRANAELLRGGLYAA
jgi:TetR/AcrR family transcriptional regulator, regulator of cefoperazone and chloramphenicol sensitivity